MEISECITIHLGSENSRIIYGRMLDFLEEHGVRIVSECEIRCNWHWSNLCCNDFWKSVV